jgi:ATP-binding cassette subfamily G (WHITE) protein 2
MTILIVLLSLLGLVLGNEQLLSNYTSCGLIQTGTNCTNSGCSWCAAQYSCLPFGQDNLCSNKCSFCSTPASCNIAYDTYADVYPPPVEYDILCQNGGARSFSVDFPFPQDYPETRFGGQKCSCRSGWTGYDCGICTSNNTCVDEKGLSTCNLGWIPTEQVPERSMSCVCTSNLCTGLLDAGPDVASISFEASLKSANSFNAEVTIHKRVPLASDRYDQTSGSDNQRDSTVMLSAVIDDCEVAQRVPCSEACKVGGCTASAVPWTDNDLCDVWTCQTATTDCPSENPLAESGDRYDFHNSVCSNPLLAQALVAPFSVACKQEADGIPSNLKYCSMATSTFPHGSLAVECNAGNCAATNDEIVPITSTSSCLGGAADDTVCENLGYTGLVFFPLAFSLATVAGCFVLSRKQQHIPLQLFDPINAKHGSDEDKLIVNGKDAVIQPATNDEENKSITIIAVRQLTLTITSGKKRRKAGVKKVVLNNINTYIGGNELLAIIGPSGSGKTSLIDIICGRKNTGKIDGYMFINGKQVTSGKQLRRTVGYVMQDDVMPGTSTVREYLSFHACLRSTSDDKHQKVSDIISLLSLESCADTLIGDHYRKGASGGEKRRVSIGIELLANKKVILMDEPTSGLDSSSSQQVINALREVVKFGDGVAVSIHQPSSRLFHQFDRVLLLSKQGTITYMGKTSEMVDFFNSVNLSIPQQYNPAEYALDVVSLHTAEEVNNVIIKYGESKMFSNEASKIESYCKPETFENGSIDADDNYFPSFKLQFITLSGRFTSTIIRHPILPTVHVLATVGISIIAMVLYFDLSNDLGGAINRAGFFFFILCYITLSSLADLGVWQEERIIFMRERASGAYGALAYILSKLLCEIVPLRILPIAVSSFILTFGIGLQNDPESLLIFMSVLMLTSLISVLLFLVIGMAIRSSGVANFVAIVIALFCLLLSGFLLIDFGYLTDADSSSNDSSGAVSDPESIDELTGATGNEQVITPRIVAFILGYFSFLRPSFELLMVNELDGLSFDVSLVDASGQSSGPSIALSGNVVLNQLGLSVNDILLDYVLLFAWIFVYLFAVSMLLTFVVVEKR